MAQQRATFQNAYGKTGNLTLRQVGRAEELRAQAERKAAPCDHRSARGSLYLSPACPRCGSILRKEIV